MSDPFPIESPQLARLRRNRLDAEILRNRAQRDVRRHNLQMTIGIVGLLAIVVLVALASLRLHG